jgi:hypothetical protein
VRSEIANETTRLMLGTARHGICEQMPGFCAAV